MNAPDGIWKLEADERRALNGPRCVGQTGLLGLSLALHWKPETIFVIVNVYIDESGTHGPSPFMVMAGYAAKLGAWNRFDAVWQKHLRRNGLTFFHAKEMNHGENEYKGWSADKVYKFARKSAIIADSHAMFGFSVWLDKSDFDSFYVGGRARNPRKF